MKLDYGASFVIWKVIALLFFPFFLWSFLGGHKQIVLGISTDHLATFFAFLGAILAIWWTGRFGSQELLAASLIILMFCSFIVSIFFAIDQVAAAKNILPHAIYATIAYGGALFFRSRLDFFYKMIFLSAFISSVVVVLSVSTLGMGGWGRATIPVFFEGKFSYFPTGYESSSDPNVLSYFLYLGALAAIYCRSINSTGKVFVALLVFAGMLTLSRSGFLAFVVAVISFQLVNLTYNLCSDKSIKVSINWMLSVVILGGVAFAIAPYFYDLGGMWDTLAERALDQASNADRFSRLKNTMEVVLDRPANFFFGHGMGFASETSDPHLLYLSTVMDTGLFSLIVFILALVIPACQCLCYTKSIRLKAFIVSLLVFFLTISLFYWQVRTYYFFMFLILTIYFHMAANQRVSSFNTRTSAGVGSEK